MVPQKFYEKELLKHLAFQSNEKVSILFDYYSIVTCSLPT